MKKILAICLSVMFVIALAAPAFAVPATTIAVNGPETVEAGQKFTVTVDLASNPGINGATIWLYYDAANFTIKNTNVKQGSVWADAYEADTANLMITKKVENGAAKITIGSIWQDEDTEEFLNSDAAGSVAQFTFTANAGIADGTYSFYLNDDASSFGEKAELLLTNVEKDKWTPTATNLTVTVGEPIPPEPEKPEIEQSATIEDGNIQQNLYIDVAEADAAEYQVTMGGVEIALDELDHTANGYKVSAPATSAKNMGDEIAWSLTKGEEVIDSGVVSGMTYANDLIEAGYEELGNAMIDYGCAAQVAFNYNVTDAVEERVAEIDPVVAERFAAAAFNVDLIDANAPVVYIAMNVTYTAEIALSVAFRVRGELDPDAAAAWLEENVTIGGDNVSVSEPIEIGEYNYIIVTKTGMSIGEINDTMQFVAGNVVTEISVENYLAAIEANYGTMSSVSEGHLKLARALFAFANAIDNIG